MISALERLKQGRGIARRKGLIILNSEVREDLLKSDIWTRKQAAWELEEEDIGICF